MILVVGQYHSSLISALERGGESYLLLKDAKRYRDADAVDFSDEATLFAHVKNLPHLPTHALATYEQYIPICARINELLGNTHALSYAAATHCTDKILMRQALSTVPGISPDFTEVSSREEALQFAATHHFPLVLKPANLSKSMLVSICYSRVELETALAQSFTTASQLYAKYTLGKNPRFIIEEFMEGSVHTVAGFIDKHRAITLAEGIVDNMSAKQAGYDDSFIFSRSVPTVLPSNQQSQIYDCTRKAIEALGLRSCPAHVELVMTSEGARIIEVGARLGGYRHTLYGLAYGYDLIGAAIASYKGERPILQKRHGSASAVLELFPRGKGSFGGLEHLNIVRELPSVRTIKFTKKIHDTIGPAAEGFKAVAFVTMQHNDSAQLERDISMIRDKCTVLVNE